MLSKVILFANLEFMSRTGESEAATQQKSLNLNQWPPSEKGWQTGITSTIPFVLPVSAKDTLNGTILLP